MFTDTIRYMRKAYNARPWSMAGHLTTGERVRVISRRTFEVLDSILSTLTDVLDIREVLFVTTKTVGKPLKPVITGLLIEKQ